MDDSRKKRCLTLVRYFIVFVFAAIMLAITKWLVVRLTTATQYVSFLAFVGTQRAPVFVDDIAFAFNNNGPLGVTANFQRTWFVGGGHCVGFPSLGEFV